MNIEKRKEIEQIIHKYYNNFTNQEIEKINAFIIDLAIETYEYGSKDMLNNICSLLSIVANSYLIIKDNKIVVDSNKLVKDLRTMLS